MTAKPPLWLVLCCAGRAPLLSTHHTHARAPSRPAVFPFCEQVVELLSTVIEHLVRGEVIQIKHALQNKSSVDEVFDVYLKKSFYKTASLMANSCKVRPRRQPWLKSTQC